MKHIYTVILSALAACTLWACSEEDLNNTSTPLTPEQQELIGKAVQFDPFVSDFASTRVGEPGYNHNGGFNSNDMMFIYREYMNKDGEWVYGEPPVSIYKYTELKKGDSELFDKSSWKVYKGKQISFTDPAYKDGEKYEKTLTEGDSITWENGTTVRFRAWALSKMSNSLDKNPINPAKDVAYPDYMVCDWVTVAGPTQNIPMSMRHLGCRIGVAPRENNQFISIDFAVDEEDYLREDNANTNAEDAADKHPKDPDPEHPEILTAQQCADNVKAIYNKLCWPAGVDMDDMSLLTCDKDGKTFKHGELTTEEIATKVKHPTFSSSVDSRRYLVTVPYDMSSDGAQGEPIILPPYTRFRIWLRDVNSGDKNATDSKESEYHILSLEDFGDTFKDGLALLPGYSYLFTVGYQYERLTATAADNFSWVEQDLGNTNGVNEVAPEPHHENYSWWKDAIKKACDDATTSSTNYNPEFHIKTVNQFQEFINLVNGHFKSKEHTFYPIYEERERIVNGKKEKYLVVVDWCTGYKDNGEPIIATEEEKAGYLFYMHYHPSEADRSAVGIEDYLKNPYSFYDEDVQRRFTVYLDNDLDLKDCELESIGKDWEHAFAGNFNAQGHVLKNVNMKRKMGANGVLNGVDGCLFGYVKDGVISNLRIESTHPISITKECNTERILGCSVIAPSTTSTLADLALGTCYFVGCVHEGYTEKPLVGKGDYYYMYGCLQAARGLDNKGALGGINTGKENFLMSQGEATSIDSIAWSNFACNYFDTEISRNAKAVTLADGSTYNETYNRIQYIRGTITHIICAKNDYLVDKKMVWKDLSDMRKMEYYGVAPWRAMNYGIQRYNSEVKEENKCLMHYEVDETGYNHRYPKLKPNAPTSSQYLDVTEQFN